MCFYFISFLFVIGHLNSYLTPTLTLTLTLNLTLTNPTSPLTVDALFESCPDYFTTHAPTLKIPQLAFERTTSFADKGGLGIDNLIRLDELAQQILHFRSPAPMVMGQTTTGNPSLAMHFEGGLVQIPTPPAHQDQSTPEEVQELLVGLRPWRKGPFHIHGVHIDSEWRSDWKWDRIISALPSQYLKDKVGYLQDNILLAIFL